MFGNRKFIIFAIVALLIFNSYALERATTPHIAEIVSVPFQDGECLKYSQIYSNAPDLAPLEYDVCFYNTESGFTEKWGGRTSTYNVDGFLRLTESDKESWRKVLGKDKEDQSRIELLLLENVLGDLNSHSIFYGPPDLYVGNLFYDKYLVSGFADYNGEPAYIVEHDSWTDTRISDKGVVLKNFWKLMFRFNRLVFKPTIRTGLSDDVIERFYYSRKTGILHGSERIWVKRDKNGNIISEDSLLKERNSKTKLISVNHL